MQYGDPVAGVRHAEQPVGTTFDAAAPASGVKGRTNGSWISGSARTPGSTSANTRGSRSVASTRSGRPSGSGGVCALPRPPSTARRRRRSTPRSPAVTSGCSATAPTARSRRTARQRISLRQPTWASRRHAAILVKERPAPCRGCQDRTDAAAGSDLRSAASRTSAPDRRLSSA